MAAWDDVPAAGRLGECAALVGSAEAMRSSAPELAVQLARRALAIGAAESAAGSAGQLDQATALSMRAHAVLAAGLVRVSRYVDAVEPAFVALALADDSGVAELATSVRLDLAVCAREVGEPLLGCALLRPVLEAPQPRSSVRAMALGRLVGCTTHVGRRDDVEDALAEADRLLASDDGLSSAARRLERARLSVRAAAYHRWYGDTEDAVEAAREGIGQLSRLRGRRPEADRLRAQLVLELVCALLDEGEVGEAESVSVALLAEPVRATSAAAVGQLMMAVSTRIHLPSGRVDRGRGLLDQAVWVAERHGLDGLLTDALTVVCQLDEHAGRAGDALESMRAARSAEQRRLRATAKAARQILAVVGAAVDWDVQAASALLRQNARQQVHAAAPVPATSPPAATPTRDTETDEATGLPNREGLFRRLHSVRNGERPVALTLVRLAENGTRSGINLTELAGRVRDIAPEDAELARSDGTELAVLLPHTTQDQAERFARSLRETAIESDWLSQANARSISTGVGQSNPDAPSVDARALLSAARHALTAAEPARPPGERTQPVGSKALTAEALAELQDVGDTLRIGRSIISSLSIPSGSGGKRRADTVTPPSNAATPPEDSSHRPSAPPNAPISDAAHDQPKTVGPAHSSVPHPPPSRNDPGPTPPNSEHDPAATREPTRPVGETGGYRPLISYRQDAKQGASEASDPTPAETERPSGHTSSYEETRAELARLMSALESGSIPAGTEPPNSVPQTSDDTAEPSVVPTPGPVTGSVTTPSATTSEESDGPRHGAGAEPTTEVGANSPTTVAPAPRQPAVDEGQASGLTRGVTAGESGLRWSFGARDPAPLPAPAEPRDDYPRNGTPLPSQSIPTPPEPSEVPEPPRRPEVPEPGEPDPVPVPPPEPGPIPPEEPGPAPSGTTGHVQPSSAENSAAARRERRAERSSDSSTLAGLLADALAAYQESAQDDEDTYADPPNMYADIREPGTTSRAVPRSGAAETGADVRTDARAVSHAASVDALDPRTDSRHGAPGKSGDSARDMRANPRHGTFDTRVDSRHSKGDASADPRDAARDIRAESRHSALDARAGPHDMYTDSRDAALDPRTDSRHGAFDQSADDERDTRADSHYGAPGTRVDPRHGTSDASADSRDGVRDTRADSRHGAPDPRTDSHVSALDARTSSHDTYTSSHDSVPDARTVSRDSPRDTYSGTHDSVLDRYSGAHDSVLDRYSGAHDSVRDTYSGTHDSASETYTGTGESAPDTYTGSRDSARDTYTTSRATYTEPHDGGRDTSTGSRDSVRASYLDSRDDPSTSHGSGLDDEFGSFDRLFDWRYRSPASGRHRSPE